MKGIRDGSEFTIVLKHILKNYFWKNTLKSQSICYLAIAIPNHHLQMPLQEFEKEVPPMKEQPQG